MLAQNVTEALSAPKTWQKLPTTLTPAAVEQFIAAADGEDRFARRDRALLELLYACGLRVSEAADLRLEDLHLDEGFIRCTGKGGKQRVVPLGSAAEAALRLYLAEARPALAGEGNDEHLFLSRFGKRLSRQMIWRLVGRYGRAAMVSGPVHPHVMRHCSPATAGQRAQLAAIQEMLATPTSAPRDLHAFDAGAPLGVTLPVSSRALALRRLKLPVFSHGGTGKRNREWTRIPRE